MIRLTLPRRVYDFFIRHWIFTASLAVIPSYYLILVRTVGQPLGLVDTANALTNAGLFIFIPLFIFSVVFALMKSLTDKYNEEVKYNGQFVLESILAATSAVKDKKTTRFCEYIHTHRRRRFLSPFQDITQPRTQIQSILENLQVCLSEITGIRRDDIGLSIIYKPGTSSADWKYLHTMNISNDLGIDDLTGNPQTTARRVLDRKVPVLFFPDKRTAKSQGQYVPGPKDEQHKGVGSILCQDISIGMDDQYIIAVLTVTTYGTQLCENDDEDTRIRLINVLLPAFVSYLKLELSLLFIKEVLANRNNRSRSSGRRKNR